MFSNFKATKNEAGSVKERASSVISLYNQYFSADLS